MSGRKKTSLALELMKYLPRVTLGNIRNSALRHLANSKGRGIHGGRYSGMGQKRFQYIRLGFERHGKHFARLYPNEPYYKNHELRRSYPHVSLFNLQRMIDMNRIDPSKPIDLVTLMNTGLIRINLQHMQFGIQLVDTGADKFTAKVNIEVQAANRVVIAAIERNGGVITTAYYDLTSLHAMINTPKFFRKGIPIPKRMIPPMDAIEYYSSAANRGYLAVPEEVAAERLKLSQQMGYVLPNIEEDPDFEMLRERKDPRQIFYGLNPGWLINTTDEVIVKPLDDDLTDYYEFNK